MQFELKPISKEGIPAALAKAQRYRLLNEPADAESICLDVLAVDPANEEALVSQLLAITDQFREELAAGLARARTLLPTLPDEYRRQYYGGIVCERYAVAQLRRAALGGNEAVYSWLRDAMEHYERAEAIRPPGNDDAILRWNSCARMLARHPSLEPAAADEYVPSFD